MHYWIPSLQIKPAVALVSLLFSACLVAQSQPNPVLTQYERQRPVSRRDTSCKNEFQFSFTTSKLTVFDSREVVYEPSEHAFCEGQPPDPAWGSTWDAQSGKKGVFRYVLSAVDFALLRSFLDRPDVETIHGFMNAGPGVGDFKIIINRPSGPQNIETLSLMPNHLELVEHPALVHLVCRAKEMARVASKSSELPDWCKDLKPLTGKAPPALF